MQKNDEYYMKIALNLAKKCDIYHDVPVGAVIVRYNQIIAKSYNQKEKKHSAVCHAEILAIDKACKKINNFRLDECTIYITKEPCLMCMGALLSARIKKIVFACYDKKYSTYKLANDNNFNHTCQILGGVMETECSILLSNFFKNLREVKKC